MTHRQNEVVDRLANAFASIEVSPVEGAEFVYVRPVDDTGRSLCPRYLLAPDCDADAEVEAVEHLVRVTAAARLAGARP